MDLKSEIMRLSSLRGVSGDEGAVSADLAARLRPLTDSVSVDPFGNVVAMRGSSRTGAPKLLIDVHIDQAGLMVTEVTDDGFARFSPIGIDARILLSNEMTILTRNGPLKAIVSALPPHLQEDGDELKAPRPEDMTLDLGMSGEKARELIRPGDFAVYDTRPVELLGGTIAGPAMDNRAGLAAVLHALEGLAGVELPCQLAVAGVTREESGLHGAEQVVRRERPEYIVVVDACHARTPDAGKYERVHEMGGGPVIGRGANSSPRMAEALIAVTERENIPYQLEAIPRTSRTDAWAAQIAACGAATVVVSLPVRYMHMPVETVRLDDVEALGKLLCAFCRDFRGLDFQGLNGEGGRVS